MHLFGSFVRETSLLFTQIHKSMVDRPAYQMLCLLSAHFSRVFMTNQYDCQNLGVRLTCAK